MCVGVFAVTLSACESVHVCTHCGCLCEHIPMLEAFVRVHLSVGLCVTACVPFEASTEACSVTRTEEVRQTLRQDQKHSFSRFI